MLFQRVAAGAKPKAVVKQATKNHPELSKLEKEIEKDLEQLRKDSAELDKKWKKIALF
jgi:chromosome segregation ATPase